MRPVLASSFIAALKKIGDCQTTISTRNLVLTKRNKTVMLSSLPRAATFNIKKSFHLVISVGSVVDFVYPPNPKNSAIVNAANEQCLGGGGVDGAISEAGGLALSNDRLALPKVQGTVRCPTGEARVTGPNDYDKLNVPYVIHAVGPNYFDYIGSSAKADALLQSAYIFSMEQAKEKKLEAVAFSLISSGIYRGEKSKRHVLEIGMKAICEQFKPYNKLKEVHMCAFSSNEADELVSIGADLGLEQERDSDVAN